MPMGMKQTIRLNERFSGRTFAGLVSSESSALVVAAVVAFKCKSLFAIYWCVPLALKLIAAMFRMQRKPLVVEPVDVENSLPTHIFKVKDTHEGFFLIEGPEALVRQFFTHFGHPYRDRFREVGCIAVVVAFTALFPAGLLALLWADDQIQYIWLGYQLYVIGTMLVCRFAGWETCGTTEERIAKALQTENNVVFEGKVVLNLVTTSHKRFGDGRDKCDELVNEHRQKS